MKAALLDFLVVFLITLCALPLHAAEKEAPELRVLSYNIKHGEGMDGKIDLARIAAVIEKLKPDLVALQEVDKNCTRSGKVDQAAELAKLLKMDSRFGKFMDFQGGEYGLAILSRLPITKTQRHQLPEGAEPRCALEVQVKGVGLSEPLSFVCIHNDWQNEAIRVKQVSALLDALATHKSPAILAGDFNEVPKGKSLALLSDDDWKILDKKGQKTFPSNKPEVEIDFFVLKNFSPKVLAHEVIDERVASDHRPIFAQLKLAE